MKMINPQLIAFMTWRMRMSMLCFSSLLLIFCPEPGLLFRIAHADADGPDFYAVTGVTANDVLNIRSGPGAAAGKLGSIPHNGRGLRNLGCEGGPSFVEWQQMNEAERKAAARRRWCRIEYQGIEGWVAGWYLREDSEPPAAAPVVAPVVAPVAAPVAALPPGMGPSFDCGQVEADSSAALVCQDARLAALDRELARVYELAAADVSADRRNDLIAMQRGWIKGRDDCWKADDKTDCITFSYIDRIAELRQGYAPARGQDEAGISRGPMPFACGDGTAVSLTFLATDAPLAHLARLQDDFALELQPSGSGSQYAGDAIVFWIRGDQALLRLPAGNETNCSLDEPG